jgi:hypothetical protein
MNVLSLRIYFSAPLHFDGWRCRFNSRSDTACWLLCDTTNTQTNIRLFQAHLHSLNKWSQSLLYRTASLPALSASLNFLPILHLPTYITVCAHLRLSTHLHLPLFLFLRNFQFVRLSLYLFLFAISSFFLLVYHFSLYILFLFIVRFPNSFFLPTYRQIPTLLPLSPSLYPHFLLSTYLCICQFQL